MSRGLLAVALLAAAAQGCLVTVGDSITQGFWPRASYRYWLWRMLLDAGIEETWVGSSTVQPYYNGFLHQYVEREPYPRFYNGSVPPARHEGHWGWRADQVLNNLTDWAEDYACRPTCAIVHLGTNDVCGPNVPTGDANYTDALVQQTVDEILNVTRLLQQFGSPDATVLLSVPITCCCGCRTSSSPRTAPSIRARP